MTADLKPYPHYKPSGVEWIGDVPAHWEVRRLKYLLSECSTRSVDGSEQLLSVSQYTGVTERKRAEGKNEVDTRAESLVGYKCVEANDLVVNIMLAWNGSMGVSRFCGIVSPSYCVYRFKTDVQPWYFHFLLRSPTYKARIRAISTGIVESRLRMYTDDLYCLEVPLPPLAEQAAIVRYLDHTDGRIRRYLRSRERLIELLKEYRQATIHETVTQGLDPDVPLKPSGAEWLGDIPAHWEVRRVKHAFRQIVGGSTPSSSEAAYWDGTIVWVTPTDVSKVTRLRDSQRRITKKGFDSCSTTLVPVGSLVVTSRAPVGNVALAEVPLCTNQGCKTLVPDSQVIDSTYGYQVFGRLKDELQSLANGTTFTEISTNALGNVLLPIPPLAEQTAIAAYLDKQTATIDAAMARAQREIDLLSEYRMRLIADVVTGQVDVREEGT